MRLRALELSLLLVGLILFLQCPLDVTSAQATGSSMTSVPESGTPSPTAMPSETPSPPTPTDRPTLAVDGNVATIPAPAVQESGETTDRWGEILITNILVEAIGVLVFGYIVAQILERQQRNYEKRQHTLISEEARMRYLTNIASEIKANLTPLRDVSYGPFPPDDYVDNFIRLQFFQSYGGGSFGRFRSITSTEAFFANPQIKTTYWDALVQSGLLPALVKVDILAGIADFYHELRTLQSEIGMYKEQLIEQNKTDDRTSVLIRSVFGDSLKDYFMNYLIPRMSTIASSGEELLGRLEKVIHVMKDANSDGFQPLTFQRQMTVIGRQAPPSASEFQDVCMTSVRSEHVHRLNIDSNRYNIHVELSPRPPSQWEMMFTVDESKLWAEASEKPEVNIRGNYLRFFMTIDEFEANLPYVHSIINETNRRFRSKLIEIDTFLAEEQKKREAIRVAAPRILATTSPNPDELGNFRDVSIAGFVLDKTQIVDEETDEYRFCLKLNSHPPTTWGDKRHEEQNSYRRYHHSAYSDSRGLQIVIQSKDLNSDDEQDLSISEFWLDIDRNYLTFAASLDELRIILTVLTEVIAAHNVKYRTSLTEQQLDEMENQNLIDEETPVQREVENIRAESLLSLKKILGEAGISLIDTNTYFH